MTPELDLTVIEEGPALVRIAAVGDIDLATAPLLDAAISNHCEGQGEVVLDLSAVRFLDSTGLAVLLKHSARAQPRCAVKVARGASETVERVFEIAGVEDLISRVDLRG
jgi:anti-anti-sigma factor